MLRRLDCVRQRSDSRVAAAEPILHRRTHVVNSLMRLAGASVQDGTFQGVAFSFGRTNLNLEDKGLLIVKDEACEP
jgi:hypothetical protein